MQHGNGNGNLFIRRELKQAGFTNSGLIAPVKLMEKKRPSQTDSFHLIHKVPVGDSPYVRAKHVQLVEKDPSKAISLFWAAINSGDRVDSALKDMAIVMKQVNRAEEAVEAIKSFRHLCSRQAQESLDNVVLDLYKRCGRIDGQIELLEYKLMLIDEGQAFGGRRTKIAQSQWKKFLVSVHQEKSRLLGNLAWAYIQKDDYQTAEVLYRKALSVEPDKNKQCNLAICLMKTGRVVEARVLLQGIGTDLEKNFTDSYVKSYERACEVLAEVESQLVLGENKGNNQAVVDEKLNRATKLIDMPEPATISRASPNSMSVNGNLNYLSEMSAINKGKWENHANMKHPAKVANQNYRWFGSPVTVRISHVNSLGNVSIENSKMRGNGRGGLVTPLAGIEGTWEAEDDEEITQVLAGKWSEGSLHSETLESNLNALVNETSELSIGVGQLNEWNSTCWHDEDAFPDENFDSNIMGSSIPHSLARSPYDTGYLQQQKLEMMKKLKAPLGTPFSSPRSDSNIMKYTNNLLAQSSYSSGYLQQQKMKMMDLKAPFVTPYSTPCSDSGANIHESFSPYTMDLEWQTSAQRSLSFGKQDTATGTAFDLKGMPGTPYTTPCSDANISHKNVSPHTMGFEQKTSARRSLSFGKQDMASGTALSNKVGARDSGCLQAIENGSNFKKEPTVRQGHRLRIFQEITLPYGPP